MPTRPEEHQLEDYSRNKFRLLLPRQWVCRDKEKDYGVDNEVEIFDDNNRAQGLLFWVQLKATSSTDEKVILNVDLPVDRLQYYKKLNVPVLLARYAAAEDAFYTKWLYNIDLSSAKKGAEKFRIKLSRDDKWNDNSAGEIVTLLLKMKALQRGAFNFPLPVFFEIKGNAINGFDKSILSAQFRREFNRFSDFIRVIESRKETLIDIRLDEEMLVVNACDLGSCTFHQLEKRPKENFSVDLAKDVLLGCAIVMLRLRQPEYCGRIIFECELEDRLLDSPERLAVLLPLLDSSHFENMLNLLTPLLDDPKNYDLSIIIQTMVLLSERSKNEKRRLVIENFLLGRLEKATNKEQAGVANYNLGNFYRAGKEYQKAIRHFMLAKRNEPKYLKQHYFFSELAGLFFLLGHFQIASGLYSRSIGLGAPPLSKALYADALLFAGKYQKAFEAFQEYSSQTDQASEEFTLKKICLGRLLETFKIPHQVRIADAANRLAGITSDQDAQSLVPLLHDMLTGDLLCGLAWFNLGAAYTRIENFSEAAFAYIMCAIVQTGDIEAWIRATVCAVTAAFQPEILFLIIRTAYFFNKEDYTEQLYAYLAQNSPPGAAKSIAETIEQMLPQEKPEKTIVRVMNEHGIFEPIYDNSVSK